MSIPETEKARNILGGIYIEETSCADNLGVALSVYFSKHIERPLEDEETESEDNYYLGDWVLEKTNKALNLILKGIKDLPHDD